MNGRDNREDHLFLWCAFLILIFVVLPALYIAHADSVNRPLLALAKAQIQVFTPFFDEAQTAWTRIAEADPSSLSWETMQKVLRYTGSWIRWPFALLLVLFGVAAIFMGEQDSVPAADRIYGKDLARIRRMDQLAQAAGRLIQDQIRELAN